MKFGFLDFSSCNLGLLDSEMIIYKTENNTMKVVQANCIFTINYDTMPLQINNSEQNEFLSHGNNESFDHWTYWGIKSMLLEIDFVMFLIKLGKFHDI